MAEALQRAWLARGALALALWPVSLLFRLLVAVRRGLYRVGLLRAERMPVPVVVVGNVIAGGAGKTPVVLALLAHLAARGIAAGVVSRGHGRRTDDCRAVQPGDDAALVGDEPLLIRQASGRPVHVALRRADAARALLRAHPDTRVILCDDGLQHLALQRDIEICVFDDRGAGNGWLLPAGPLREPWPRAVAFVLRPPAQAAAIAGHDVTRALADHAVRADGTRKPLAELAALPFVALAGIARPASFFAMLRERGLSPARAVPLPDHHDFDVPLDLPADTTLVCTAKDAVKLWRTRPDAWSVPLELRIAPEFWSGFDRALDAQLSSRDGSQTA